VPILYLPYLSFPLGEQRKSGFLFPNLGHTTRSGAAAHGAVLLQHRAELRR
jgi:lipopolysaccharide assembly outer membrane protein LptD (OstA)